MVSQAKGAYQTAATMVSLLRITNHSGSILQCNHWSLFESVYFFSFSSLSRSNTQVLIRFPIHTHSIIDILTNRSGANFGKTLVNYESHPSKDATQRHQALSRRWDTDQFKNVVVMFREPRQRLISSYYAIQRYHDTCCNLDWGLKALERKILVSKIVKGQSLGETITKYKGCVANMIIGYQCMDVQAPRLTATRMALARKRMSEFLFVGIQSHYELSMCLFNHIATGHKFILPEQQDPTTQNQTVPINSGFNTTTNSTSTPTMKFIIRACCYLRILWTVQMNNCMSMHCLYFIKKFP
jgi:hypothetical protein